MLVKCAESSLNKIAEIVLDVLEYSTLPYKSYIYL